MARTTITAVRCAVCGDLHQEHGSGYIELQGKIVVPAKQPRDERTQFLGSEENPTIICMPYPSNMSCLLKFLKLSDGDRY